MSIRQDFATKTALITAGASGIGAAAVRSFIERGGRAVIADIDEAGGAALAAELGASAHYHRCDVADIDSAAQAVEATIEHFGALDCLFNNAGKATMSVTPDTPVADWKMVIDITLNSVYHLCRAAIPHFRGRGGGVIVNTASVSGLFGDYMMAAYNAAKGGVINYTRALALDHADDNIRVNAVCPGLIWDTAMTQHLADLPGGWEPWKKSIPMRRGGNAAEVACAMLFLASEEASYITGTTLAVDGGLTAQTCFPDLRSALS
jgi:meso-butanediol dehydrogenase / (S,S)-butanediol dehydrogenase / diacetyl reductase